MSTGADAEAPAGCRLRFVGRRYDDPLVAHMVAAVQDDYRVRYGGPDGAPIDPEDFVPPRGRLLLAVLDEPAVDGPDELGVDGQVVAMGAWRRLREDPATAEVKRMYVPEPHRRRGYARAMLSELVESARGAGISRLVLNTGRAQPEAIALYEATGWQPSEPFGHYACTPGALFFRRDIRGPAE